VSLFFRAVCGCAQRNILFIGDPAQRKLLDAKKKQHAKEEFAKDLVWFPVVVAIHGALVTYDEPDASFLRVGFLDPFGDTPSERQGGWLEDPASSMADHGKKVTIACDEQYQIDGTTKTVIDRADCATSWYLVAKVNSQTLRSTALQTRDRMFFALTNVNSSSSGAPSCVQWIK
jgi:hypothetical protein